MEHKQLTFWEMSKTEELDKELHNLKNTLGNMRRGLFKRNSNLANDIKNMQDKIESLQNQLFILEKFVRNSNPELVDSPKEFLFECVL